jgi:hypothetical protein
MKTFLATILAPSIVALGLIGATGTSAAVIGVHVGPVGVGIGHYHYHHHWYHHRRWHHHRWHYW